MSELVDFLRARLDEDERMARATTGPWKYHHETGGVVLPTARHVPELTEIISTPREPSDARHMVRWDSVRVLREVETKRLILADHTTPHTVVDGFCVEEGGKCTHTGEGWCSWHGTDDCPTVRALALPHLDHPDYREEWRQ